jgi:4-hydroxy-tetrahydrodipicolinate reductase
MTRVVQMGLGPIGRAIARRVHQEPGLELVGAIDPAPEFAGRDLGEVIRTGPLGIPVEGEAERALERMRPSLVLHATGSFLVDVAPQLRALLERGVDVVSTCEELSFPRHTHPRLARELDDAARARGAVLLGTGVNPGFVMDKLVVTLMAACTVVREVRVRRVVDVATRREPLLHKVGAGLAPAAFEQRARDGRIGHVGLAESAHMLGDAMGLGAERRLEQTLRAVIAEQRRLGPSVTVEAGQVAGVHQAATLWLGELPRVRLELEMHVGAPRPHDAVTIEGSPQLEMEITSGVAGDEGTVSVVVHCAGLVDSLEPGLRTMLDVPLRPSGSTVPRG